MAVMMLRKLSTRFSCVVDSSSVITAAAAPSLTPSACCPSRVISLVLLFSLRVHSEYNTKKTFH